MEQPKEENKNVSEFKDYQRNLIQLLRDWDESFNAVPDKIVYACCLAMFMQACLKVPAIAIKQGFKNTNHDVTQIVETYNSTIKNKDTSDIFRVISEHPSRYGFPSCGL